MTVLLHAVVLLVQDAPGQAKVSHLDCERLIQPGRGESHSGRAPAGPESTCPRSSQGLRATESPVSLTWAGRKTEAKEGRTQPGPCGQGWSRESPLGCL